MLARESRAFRSHSSILVQSKGVGIICVRSLYCLFIMLLLRPSVFSNPVRFDVKPFSMKSSFALLSPNDNYYLLLRIQSNLGARVFVAQDTE